MSLTQLWEVFVRPRHGLEHRHCGSLHAEDEVLALQAARNIYTRREEGESIWVVPSKYIFATDPNESESLFEPSKTKAYRHPSFYEIPKEIGHM